MLHNGYNWRIRDEKLVKIWTDNWIPKFYPLQVQTNMTEKEIQNARVSSLIDSNTNW